MSYPASALKGVLPVLQTPYHQDESIDFDALQGEILWAFSQGADGVVVAMVSEILRMSSEERERTAEHVCRCAETLGPVIISVGAESSHLAERYATHAESVGASAVMAIPPVGVAVADHELYRYYSRIIAASTLPVVVQDASGYVGKPMSIDFQARLLIEFGDRIFFKPEASPIGQRLSALRDATKSRARIFEGSGGVHLVDSFRRGIIGTMPGAELLSGIVTLWKALGANDDSTVQRVALPIGALVALQTNLDAYLAVEKYLLVKQGVLTNTIVRGPVGFTLDAETRQEVDRLFALIQSALS